MESGGRTWQEELAIIDRTLRAISRVSDPEELVGVYWEGVQELLPSFDYLALSRRGVEPPEFLITRSVRFTEEINPWTQRERLPRMRGGLLGELAYADRPVVIEDLPARLAADDPGAFYLEGYGALVALPHYDEGVGMNITVGLFPPGAEWDPRRIPMMHWHGGLFGRGTQNLVLRNRLDDALRALDRELRVVGEIQRSLLPRELPRIEGFDIAASYETSARAGGDYYDFFPLDRGEWGVFIADVAGHGTPAAVLMAVTHAIAHARPGTHTPPGRLLAYLNEQLTRSYTRTGAFITAFYAVLNPGTGELTYARAGHNPPRLVRGGRVASLDATGALPLGIVEEQAYEQASARLEPGDLLLLYTDGITEAMAPRTGNDDPRLFGIDRLDALLLDCGAENAAGCVERIRAEVAAFRGGAPQADDQTLIAVRCA